MTDTADDADDITYRHTFRTPDGVEHECEHDWYHIPDCVHLLPTNDDVVGRRERFTEPYGLAPDGRMLYVEAEEAEEGRRFADFTDQ
jgi:hypothetical protein